MNGGNFFSSVLDKVFTPSISVLGRGSIETARSLTFFHYLFVVPTASTTIHLEIRCFVEQIILSAYCTNNNKRFDMLSQTGNNTNRFCLDCAVCGVQ